MAYDAARRLHVLFGSQFSDDPHTWTYDLRRNQWRDARPPLMPPTAGERRRPHLRPRPPGRARARQNHRRQGRGRAQHRVETWAYDTGANRWTKLDPQPSSPRRAGNRARQLLSAPELNLAILENCTVQATRTANLDLPLCRGQDRVDRRCRQAQAALAAAHRRGRGRLGGIFHPGRVQLDAADRPDRDWLPRGACGGGGAHRGPAHAPQTKHPAFTRAVRGRHPPHRAVPAPHPQPARQTSFADTSVDLTRPQNCQGELVYERALHAGAIGQRRTSLSLCASMRIASASVNDAGLESGPSPALFTIPSSPQWLFSKEDGADLPSKVGAQPRAAPQRLPRLPTGRALGKGPCLAAHAGAGLRHNLHRRHRRSRHSPLLRCCCRRSRPGRISLCAGLVRPRVAAALHTLRRRMAPVIDPHRFFTPTRHNEHLTL